MSRTEAIERHIETSSDYDVREWYLKKTIQMYKAKDDDNFMDIIGPKDTSIWFGLKIFVHFNLGPNNDAMLCNLSMKKGNCYVCEERKTFPFEDGKLSDEAKQLFPSIRFLYFIVDRMNETEEGKGIQLYDAPKTIDEEIRNLSRDPKSGKVVDISDPEEGFTFYFQKKGKGINTSYKGFQLLQRDYIVFKPEWSELVLKDYLVWITYEQGKELFLGYSNDSPVEEESNTEKKSQEEEINSDLASKLADFEANQEEIPF
jgi:hypothetical protein